MPGHGSSPAHGDAERIKRTPPSAEVFALPVMVPNVFDYVFMGL
jgi:hypothetical protein